MKKVVMSISLNTKKWYDFFEMAMAELPDEKKEAFAAHWYSLEDAGCVIAEFLFRNGTLYCAPSDDFRRALAEFGVVME